MTDQELDRTCKECGAPAYVRDEFSMYGVNGEGQDCELFMERVQCVAEPKHLFAQEVVEMPAPWVWMQWEAQEKADREARHREYDP